ncbi:hypothetical protein TWF694_008995 [Orbilia ellipsospora]|uniref:Uncharacterized protein n=1 Tax=Orbilia ellipsospora TaxID=2528407 RepID=A0AAV9XES8_9PEZI
MVSQPALYFELAGSSFFIPQATINDCRAFLWTPSTIAPTTIRIFSTVSIQTVSVTKSAPLVKRDVFNTIPAYATIGGCSNIAAYSSACQCIGVTTGGTTYVRVGTATTTILVTATTSVTPIPQATTTIVTTGPAAGTTTLLPTDGSGGPITVLITEPVVSVTRVASTTGLTTVFPTNTPGTVSIIRFVTQPFVTITQVASASGLTTKFPTDSAGSTITDGSGTITIITYITQPIITVTRVTDSAYTSTQYPTDAAGSTITNGSGTITVIDFVTQPITTKTQVASATGLSTYFPTNSVGATITDGSGTITVITYITQPVTTVVTVGPTPGTTTKYPTDSIGSTITDGSKPLTIVITQAITTVTRVTNSVYTSTQYPTNAAGSTITDGSGTVIVIDFVTQPFTTITRTASSTGLSTEFPTDSAGATITDGSGTISVITYLAQSSTTVVTTGPSAGTTTQLPTGANGSPITDGSGGTVTVQITEPVITVTQTNTTTGLSTIYPTDSTGSTITDGSGTITIIATVTPTAYALQLTDDAINAQFKGQYLVSYTESGTNNTVLNLTADSTQAQAFNISVNLGGNVTSLSGEPFAINGSTNIALLLQQPTTGQTNLPCWIDSAYLFRCQNFTFTDPFALFAVNSTAVLTVSTSAQYGIVNGAVGPLVVQAVPYAPGVPANTPAAASKQIVLQADPGVSSNGKFSGQYLGFTIETPSDHPTTHKRLTFISSLTPANASIYVVDPIIGNILSLTNEPFLYNIYTSISPVYTGFQHPGDIRDDLFSIPLNSSSLTIRDLSPGYPFYAAEISTGKIMVGAISVLPTSTYVRPLTIRAVFI